MNYLIDITPDTLVRVTLKDGITVNQLAPVTVRNALLSGEPVPLVSVLEYLCAADVVKLTVILPEGSNIEVEQPRKFTLPLVAEFVAAQAKKGGAAES